jgi:hypothetical protein
MHLKHFEIVQQLDKGLTRTQIQWVINQYSTIKHYAYILHDKDVDELGEPVAPHWHIYLSFGGISQDSDMVAGWFGVPTNCVEKIKHTRKKALQYQIHKNAPEKYQYDINEVSTNLDFLAEIKDNTIVGDFKNYTRKEMLDYIDTLPPYQKAKQFDLLRKIEKFEDEKRLNSEGVKNMQVYYVTGVAGIGKTTWSKWWLKQLGLSYYNTGAGNDMFQDYRNQRSVIIDDFRPSQMIFAEFLKLADNHTNSAVRSRYSNKMLYIDKLVINSTIDLKDLYTGGAVSGESMRQLYRRIYRYVYIDKDEVRVYDKIDLDTGAPIRPYKAYKRQLEKWINETGGNQNELNDDIEKVMKNDD